MGTLLCAKQEAGEHISSKGAYLLEYLNAYLEHINNGVRVHWKETVGREI